MSPTFPSVDDGLRTLHEQYIDAVNRAVAEDRADLVDRLAADYADDALRVLVRAA